MSKFTLGIVVLGSILAAAGQVAFKIGATGRQSIVEFLNIWICIGLFSYGIGTICWIGALSKEKLSNVYPFTVLTFVLVYISSAIFLHEHISLSKLIGVLTVLGGLYILAQVN